jgi:hypothetical protein
MVTRHSSKRRQEARQRADQAGTTHGHEQVSEPPDPDPLPKHATAAIDVQRRTLQMADSVLSCLVTALDYSTWVKPSERPDYADAVQAVRRMLSTAIDRLDSVNLKRAIAENKSGSP